MLGFTDDGSTDSLAEVEVFEQILLQSFSDRGVVGQSCQVVLGRSMSTAPTDAELAELYERYAPVILRRARSILGNEELAQDAVQETFAKVICRWDQFRGEASPTTWIYRITTNHCLNQIRNQRGRQDKLAMRREELAPAPVSMAEHGIDVEVVRGLLAGCDDETRRIMLHIYFDDMTREETARVVGRSLPTVRKRIRTFMDHARTHLTTIRAAASVSAAVLLANWVYQGGLV
jgi:RNA polymerase sigma-70 factor, ECF subfamily